MSYFTQGVTNVTSGQYNLLVTDLSNYGAGMYFGGVKDASGNITGQYGYMTATKADGVVVDGTNKKVLIQNTAGSLTLDTAGKIAVSSVKFTGDANDTSANNVFLTADKDGKLVRDYNLYNQYNAFNTSISGRVKANEINIANNLQALLDTSGLLKTTITNLTTVSGKLDTYATNTNITLANYQNRLTILDSSSNELKSRVDALYTNDSTTDAQIAKLQQDILRLTPEGTMSMAELMTQHANAINDIANVINGLNVAKPVNPDDTIHGAPKNVTIPYRAITGQGPQAVSDFTSAALPAPGKYDISGVYMSQDSSGYIYIIQPGDGYKQLASWLPGPDTSGVLVFNSESDANGTLLTPIDVAGSGAHTEETNPTNIASATATLYDNNATFKYGLFSSAPTYTDITTFSGTYNGVPGVRWSTKAKKMNTTSYVDVGGFTYVGQTADMATPQNYWLVYRSNTPYSGNATLLYHQPMKSVTVDKVVTYGSPISINVTSAARPTLITSLNRQLTTSKFNYAVLSSYAMGFMRIYYVDITISSALGGGSSTTFKLQGQYYDDGTLSAPVYGVTQNNFTLSQFGKKWNNEKVLLSLQNGATSITLTVKYKNVDPITSYPVLEPNSTNQVDFTTLPTTRYDFSNGVWTKTSGTSEVYIAIMSLDSEISNMFPVNA